MQRRTRTKTNRRSRSRFSRAFPFGAALATVIILISLSAAVYLQTTEPEPSSFEDATYSNPDFYTFSREVSLSELVQVTEKQGDLPMYLPSVLPSGLKLTAIYVDDAGMLITIVVYSAEGNKDYKTAEQYFQTAHLQVSVKGPLPGEDKWARRMRSLVAHLEKAMALEDLEGKRRLSEWMPGLLEILVRVYGNKPLELSNRRVRQMVAASARIKAAAVRLKTLPPPLDVEVEA